MKLTYSNAVSIAKEMTITAMEHSMIRATNDPVETAKHVTDFFNHIADTLYDDTND